ncbi:MAG TPA: 2-C-methyl-D-erythritol 4-phosphate cytidylyltransferase, partial [Turneriella sp.]|nr:2-C-methyl-D-erythritol 4-phosphate cytidylyltransferase [Turneriella sp.]
VTARKLLSSLPIDVVIFVSPKNTMGTAVVNPVIEKLKVDFPKRKMKFAAAGGTRFVSFCNGLHALRQFTPLERLIVHDANRPYLTPTFLERVGKHLRYLSSDLPAFIPVVPVVDSVVRLDGKNIVHYENRQELARVQTPQLIHYPTFDEKFGNALGHGRLAFDFTDEGSLTLSLGMSVGTFEGDLENIKITYPEDLKVV